MKTKYQQNWQIFQNIKKIKKVMRQPNEGQFSLSWREIVGNRGSTYYIDRSAVVMRTWGQFVIYSGTRKEVVAGGEAEMGRFSSREQETVLSSVYIKEYSEGVRPQDIRQEWEFIQLITSEKQAGKNLQNIFIQMIEDIINRKFYLILTPFKQTLYDQLRYGYREYASKNFEQNTLNFCRQFSVFLKTIHQDLTDAKQLKKTKILTNLSPQLIAFAAANSQTCFLTTFAQLLDCKGDTLLPFDNQNKVNVEYYAPEMKEKKICSKSNIWTFGCILFEILTDGQKLIESSEVYSKMERTSETKIYVSRRLEYLNFIMERSQNANFSLKGFWLNILSNCLQPDHENRWTSTALFEHFQTPNPHLELPALSEQVQNTIKNQLIFSFFYQHSRTSMIMSKIINIFYQLGSNSQNVLKYVIYIMVKFSVDVLLKLYLKAKKKALRFSSIHKSESYFHFIDPFKIKKMKEIKNKITQLIEELMENEERYIQKNNFDDPEEAAQRKRLFNDIKRYFPEYLDYRLYGSKNLLNSFCFKYFREICQNKQIGEEMSEIILYVQGLGDVEELNYNQKQLKGQISGFALKKMYYYIHNCEERAKDMSEIYETILSKTIHSEHSLRVSPREKYLGDCQY